MVSSPVSRNPGTSQFWKILYSCLHKVSTKEDFGPLLRSTSTEKRIGKKIELLHGLRQAGIWLMDGSIVGINRKSPSLRKKILIQCWNYTHSTLQNLNPRPEQIVVIGCLVKKALKNQLDSLWESNVLRSRNPKPTYQHLAIFRFTMSITRSVRRPEPHSIIRR